MLYIIRDIIRERNNKRKENASNGTPRQETCSDRLIHAPRLHNRVNSENNQFNEKLRLQFVAGNACQLQLNYFDLRYGET